MTNFKSNWWKWLGVVLLLYTIVFGFQIPINAGILNVPTTKVKTGENANLKIECYNTHFSEAEDVRVYLMTDDNKLLTSSQLNIVDDNKLNAVVEIPNNLDVPQDGTTKLTAIVTNEIDGFIHQSDAVIVSKGPNSNSYKTFFTDLSILHQTDDFRFPFRPILYETIRNTFFHVAIWMAMFLLLIVSCGYSIAYLRTKNYKYDHWSASITTIAIVFGIAGLLTGMMWANYTWGTPWTNDIKLNMTAISLMVYLGYWILRSSIKDVDSRARLAAIFNLFAFVNLMILVMVIPRFTDSLHPGNGGNPAFGSEDLDNTLRAIFYPAIIGYFLIGLWMSQLSFRFRLIEEKIALSQEY